MYELIKLNENDHYIESPAKIGLTVRGSDAYLIDSGNDKDAGKKAKRHIDENGWTLRAIFNTHSHADHIGGNDYLQRQTGCKIYAKGIEADFTCHPLLEPALLYGGNPPKELRHKFLMAQPSNAEPLTPDVLPKGLEIIDLPGHSFDMVGFKTESGAVYLADCLSSAETLEKYKLGYIFDPETYVETLKYVKELEGRLFVPSHAVVTDNIAPLAQLNIDKVNETAEILVSLCTQPITSEELLYKVFEYFGLQMSFEQHALIGSTLRSYLTWLKNSGRIEARVENNRIVYCKI